MVDVLGLHYHPKYWDDPKSFKPDRFHGKWSRDAFLPFSTGARGCIGRRFSETEAIVFLTMVIGKYRVELWDKDGAFKELRTVEEKREKLFRVEHYLTTTPLHVPLVFRPRSSGAE